MLPAADKLYNKQAVTITAHMRQLLERSCSGKALEFEVGCGSTSRDRSRAGAKGKLQRAKGKLQRAKGRLQRAKSKLQRAKGKLQRAKNKLQRAKSPS